MGPITRTRRKCLRKVGSSLKPYWKAMKRPVGDSELRAFKRISSLAGAERDWKANHTLNKVIRDLHAEEIVALPGRLLVDAGTLGMLILTGTGFYLCWKPRRVRAAKPKAVQIRQQPSGSLA